MSFDLIDEVPDIGASQVNPPPIAMARSASTPIAGPTPPKRGWIHSSYGVFIGGAKLGEDYKCVAPPGASLYRFSSQRRNEKSIAKIEENLRQARDSVTSIKFDGKLEPPDGNLTEIGKERFIQLIKRKVIEHGQQSFYCIRDTDGKVVSLFEHSHRFRLDAVVAEHNRRLSFSNQYETYDAIERDENEMTRMVFESTVTDSFLEKLTIRYSHREDFDYLPGSCLFMMALEACNASVSHDVDGARIKLEAMTLDSYPGENVSDFAADAQKQLKIMNGGYAMPIHTGSGILKKLTKTSSEFFNRKIFALLDLVKTMEHEYKLVDPKTLSSNKDYSTLGPLGIIATLQAAHGALLTEHDWPALASTLPQANVAATPSANATPTSTSTPSTTPSATPGGRRAIRCFRCHGQHHVRDCPEPATSGPTNADGTRGARQLAAWKYVRPADLTVPYVDNRGRSWKFCTQCRCRATDRVGIYQLSHFDTEHRAPDPGPPAVAAAAPPARSSDPAPAIAPQSNLTQVLDPHPLPPGPPAITGTVYDLDDFAAIDDDPDAIEFQGMWCAAVYSTDAPDVSVVTLPVERENGLVTTTVKIEGDDDGDDDCTWFDCDGDEDIDSFFESFEEPMEYLDNSPNSSSVAAYSDQICAPVTGSLAG